MKTSNNLHSGYKIIIRGKICATPVTRDLSAEDTSLTIVEGNNFKNLLAVKGNTLHKGQDQAKWSQKVDRHARLSLFML